MSQGGGGMSRTVPACHMPMEAAVLFMDRIIAATSRPGSWGEMLAAGAGLWFAISLALPDLTPESPALAALTENFGRQQCAAWFAAVALFSIWSMGTTWRAARILASHAAMFTWLCLVLVVCWRSGVLAPAVGAYTMFFIACCASTRSINEAG